MHSINWQHLAKENKRVSETIYEVSSVRVIEFDDRGCPINIEVITAGFGTMNATPHPELGQRIYVMNDNAKTIVVYDIPRKDE